MAFAPQKGDVQVSPGVFGGWVTDQPAETLPEGVSPDNQDCEYLPGSVSSRRCLQHCIFPPFPNNVTVTYAKTFVTSTGDIENLYLTSDGLLWFEDVTNSPGTVIAIGRTAPGVWAKSVTFDGREYIAISDGLHGQDAPLQWDGTSLTRVTREGPAAPPAVASIALPSVAMAVSGSPVVLSVTQCNPFFGAFNIVCSGDTSAINVGEQITVASSSVGFYNAAWAVGANYPNVGAGLSILIVFTAVPNGTAQGTGGTVTSTSSVTMTRQNNIVTVNCASAHGLRVGYQAQITGVGAATIATISTIVIDNENLPGVATITTSAAHGLVPNSFVSLVGVNPVSVGGGISSIAWQGGLVTVTTASAHGLAPSSIVGISGTTNYNVGAAVVLQTPSTTTFTYAWSPLSAPAGESSGAVNLAWPITDTGVPTYYEVIACPTSTTFQVAVNYGDGTWTSGSVQYEWDGTFYVSAVPTLTTFQYQQYGPNSTTNTVGTVTPWGQAAPGIRQCQVLFLYSDGFITAPSPPVQVVTNGGQYISVSNIPLGPLGVVARILAFTGAGGSLFFYIDVPGQSNGQTVSTSTVVNDNATTSVLLDFGDLTLFAATGINVPGNNLPAQIVLEGALGFGVYASRLVTWGQRNRIQNLLNLGFEGGFASFATLAPLGWTAVGSLFGSRLVQGGTLVNLPRVHGMGWEITMNTPNIPAGQLQQSMYQDAYGNPIATPNTQYRIRCLLQSLFPSPNWSFFAFIKSASTGFVSEAFISGSQATPIGAYVEASFSAATPASIPTDLVLQIYAQAGSGVPTSCLVDEISIIYSQTPYTDTTFLLSYVDNPQGFDGLSGKLGATDDVHKVMALAEIRDTLYWLTQDPGGRLHETQDNGVTEPSGWTTREVAANCGCVSAFGLTVSQADEATPSGGEEWFAWVSAYSARIFGGGLPQEISREIAPNWTLQGSTAQFCWAVNDPSARQIYFGMVLTGRQASNIMYVLNYIGLNSAADIANTGPVRISYTGHLIATDHARKWTRWNLTLNGAALMSRAQGNLQPVFFAGNGFTPNTVNGFGNVYTLAPKQTDDDYGRVFPYYVTFFMPGKDVEQAVQMAGVRKLLAYVMAYWYGIGNMTVTPYINNLSNPWGLTVTRQMTLTPLPTSDEEFAGCSAQGNRIALKFASSPLPNQTDNSFTLSRLTCWIRKALLQIRGTA